MATNDTTVATNDGTDAPRLGRLSELHDYQVAEGYPDIRGWDVKTRDGQTIGKVDDLVVDTGEMRTRYVDVELDRSVGELARDAATPGDQERHTLLPIGSVQLAESNDDVVVDGYTLQQIASLPRYGGTSITPDYERAYHAHRLGLTGLATGAAASGMAADKALDYAHTDYDDQRLYANRRNRASVNDTATNTTTNADEQRLTLAEEQLVVGKRQTSGGEVTLQKTVETERVREQVALSHDEVSVERRPITDASAARDVQIGEDEIRIPVMEERIVTQKVLVPREEIIVRKRQVTEQRTVEDDVRRERVDVDDSTARATARTTNTDTTDRPDRGR